MTSAKLTGAHSGGRLAFMMRALKHRNFRLFFTGQLVSLVGTFLTKLATVWLVYELTKSAWWLGVAGFAAQIPMFFLAPFAGVWVDRLDRQKLLITTQSLAMCQSFGLAAVAFFDPNVGAIIALAFTQGMINAFDMPGRQAFLLEMVSDRDDLANAIALNSTMVHMARLIGPALAGLLIAYVGEGWCFTLDGFSYIGVIVAFAIMKVAPRIRKASGRSAWNEMREGMSYAWNFVPARVLLILAGVISLIGMPAYSVLMPIFGDYLSGRHHGAEILGVLMGASGAGALVGALMLASRRTVVGLGHQIAIAAAIFGGALVAFSWSRVFWISMIIVPFAGYGMLTVFASINTLLQTIIDDDKRGRVMALFGVAFAGMSPWGNLISGIVAQHVGWFSSHPQIMGAAITITGAGIICFAAAIVFAKYLPIVRRIVRPIYVKKGIITEVAKGLAQSANLDIPASGG